MAISDGLAKCVIQAMGDTAAGMELVDRCNANLALSSTEAGYLDSVTAGTGAASKAAVLDSSGDWYGPNGGGIVIGHSAQLTVAGVVPELQVLGTTTGVDGSMALVTASTTNGDQSQIILGKVGNAALGSFTTVAQSESLGAITWVGDDGTDTATVAARIGAVVNATGTVAASRIPCDLVFYTDPGGADDAIAEAMRLKTTDLHIANGGGLVVGHSAQITVNALVPEAQVLGNVVGVDGAMLVGLYSSTAAEGPEIILARSKSATLGTNTIVASGDSLGRIVAMGADGGTGFDPAAAITFEVAGTPGASTDMPGRILFQTSPDGSQTPATRCTVLSGATSVAQIQMGTAGTSTGSVVLAGATSGTTTVSAQAVAGAWTMALPAAVGSAGQQLTDAGGDGVCSWAAASLGAWKNDEGILDPYEALLAVVGVPTHKFTYNKDVLPPGQWDGCGMQMTGIFAEEAPWAMHGPRDGLKSGIAFSPVNAFGYARAAIEALYNEVLNLKAQLSNKTEA